MTEYIRRDTIILTDFEIVMCDRDYKEGLAILLNKVKKAPAADVMEAKHGWWQNSEDAKCYQCSVCGKYRNQEYGLDGPIFDKFCPNCGAKMDGGQD